MKSLGYVLLIIGFLWIVEDVTIGFPHNQVVKETSHIVGSDLPPPYFTMTPIRDMHAAIQKLSVYLTKRHRLILLPACLMLAGGIMLGAQRRPVVKEASITEPERKPRVDEIRWDSPSSWRPEEGVSFRKAMLWLARRAVVRSPFFRNRKPEEHDTEPHT